MTKEAEMNAEEDGKKRDSAETKNILERCVHSREIARDNGDKVSPEIKTKVEERLPLQKLQVRGQMWKQRKASTELSDEFSKNWRGNDEECRGREGRRRTRECRRY